MRLMSSRLQHLLGLLEGVGLGHRRAGRSWARRRRVRQVFMIEILQTLLKFGLDGFNGVRCNPWTGSKSITITRGTFELRLRSHFNNESEAIKHGLFELMHSNGEI